MQNMFLQPHTHFLYPIGEVFPAMRWEVYNDLRTLLQAMDAACYNRAVQCLVATTASLPNPLHSERRISGEMMAVERHT